MKNESNLGSYNGDALDTKTIIPRCIDNTPGICLSASEIEWFNTWFTGMQFNDIGKNT